MTLEEVRRLVGAGADFGADAGVTKRAVAALNVAMDVIGRARRVVSRLDNGDSIEPGWYEVEELRQSINRAVSEH